MKQDLGFAWLHAGLDAPVAAGVRYPVFGLLPSLLIAALAMRRGPVSVMIDAVWRARSVG